jgi:hypothetical protein
MALSSAGSGQEPGVTVCDYLNGALGSVDYDRDGVENCRDNCPLDSNADQKDSDVDGVGDACARQRKEWEGSRRELRRQAREAVDLPKLIARSSDVVLGRLTGFGWLEDGGRVAEVEVIRRFKDSTDPRYQQYARPMWVFVPEGGPPELAGELLLFLKNDKARGWKNPAVWPEPLRPGVAPEGLKYFRYELADLRHGVLGVSTRRLIEIQKIIKPRNPALRSNNGTQRTRN